MPGVDELQANPLVFVDSQFEKYLKDGGSADKFPQAIIKQLCEKLSLPEITQVSIAQLNGFVGRLVRFRAMTQDMSSPEFYAVKYEAEENFKPFSYRQMTGIFRDELAGVPDELKFFVPAERICLHCVEIPGETDWVKSRTFGNVSCGVDSRMEEDVREQSDAKPKSIESSMEEEVKQDSEAKRTKTEDGVGLQSSSMSHRIPIPERSSVSCFVKIYDRLDDVKLNEVVEFVGMVGTSDSIPVVHVISFTQLTHINPLPIESLAMSFPSIRDRLISHISSALGNDQIAAEYLLCNLISSIYHRRDIIPLGKFSLNLTNVTIDQVDLSRNLFTFISSLVTKAHFIPLSLATLNCSEFVPKKNFDTDELHSGQLQLSRDTHLILDETALSPGQLNEKGLKNLAALKTLVRWQKLDFDFQFHSCEFHMDLPMVIMSEGKSILNADFVVPLVKSNQSAAEVEMDEAQLNSFRSYITATKSLQYSIDNSLQKIVEETFVSMRQADPTVSTDDLSNLLVLARLLSISHGQTQLTSEMWTRAVVMENLRKFRLNANRGATE